MRDYFILHFKEYEDVIDYEHSKVIGPFFEGDSVSVAVPTLKSDKIDGLNCFTIKAVCGTIVSHDVKMAITKAGCGESLMFKNVRLDKGD